MSRGHPGEDVRGSADRSRRRRGAGAPLGGGWRCFLVVWEAVRGYNLLVAGCSSSYRLRRFFGGLHGADIDEILGMNLVAVWQHRAQGRARFR